MAPKAQKIVRPNERGQIGRQGEQLAVDFLEAQGCVIVARNWRCRFGEIDIIAERDRIIHFIEVKTRRGSAFGYPEESVTSAKRQRWFRAIEYWLQFVAPQVRTYQADVISILWTMGEPRIEWIQNVAE